MMNRSGSESAQRGVALTIAMLFLLIVTIVSVVAATNSSVGLKMSANMQDSYQSFQSAEAGLAAVLALAGTVDEPFNGDDDPDPLGGIAPHPLAKLQDGADSVDLNVEILSAQTDCPPKPPGSSVDLFNCDYYRVSSQHSVPLKAQTRVEMGVVRTTIGTASR